jgi:serine-type D-Ala-D-Ala carboxypeptidase/endopeptidase (penicillin-binding protein 4)
MKVRFILILFFLFIWEHLSAQTGFEEVLQNMLAKPEYKNAQVGLLIMDVDNKKVLYELNSEKLMIPASALKLVTSAAALEILGSDYRFETRLGYAGKIENGILKGDLIVIGGGDPALGSEYFPNHYFSPHFLSSWVKRVRETGINKIEGRLVIDNSLYGSERIPPTWIWEDMGNYYGAGSGALSLYDNLSRIKFQSPPAPGRPATMLSVYPELKGIQWINEVHSSDIARDLAYVFGSPIDSTRIIRGTIPKNRRIFTIKASNPHPESLLADEFLRYLASSGIFVTGNVLIEKTDQRHFHQIAVLESPTLAEIVKFINHESVNLFAEHLVKQIAAELTGIGDRETGLKIISDFWKGKGLDNSQLFMEDGSGLSHFNAVTPAFLSAVLQYMKFYSPVSSVFYESLPAAGTGTMMLFNAQHFPDNTLRLKSGSMTRVRCYAGYLTLKSGDTATISVMLNHFSGTQSKLVSEIEELLVSLRSSY